MKKTLFLLNILVLAVTSVCYANEQKTPELLSVTPNTIKMRHAQDLRVEINHWQPGTQISITPGGAYITSINSITSSNKQQFPDSESSLDANINQLSKEKAINNVSPSHVCFLFENKQLAIKDLLTGKIIRSVIKKTMFQPIKIVKTLNDSCLSIDQQNNISLWQQKNQQLIQISNYHSSGYVYELLVQDNKIIIANGRTGLSILTIKNNSLQWLASYNKLGNITQVAIQDEHIMVADDQGVLTLLNISNVNTPLLISDFHLHGNISDLRFKDNKARVIQQNKLIEIDFSANSTPIISTLGVNQGGSRRSFIKNDTLYVADWFSGLHIYDIRLPRAPRLLASYSTPGSAKGVIVRNGTAFVADDDHGLQVVDVSDPRALSFISEIPLSGLAYTMKLVDNLLYIASHRGGFHIVDVSNVKQPRLVSSYDTPGKAWALEYRNGLLYVADDNSGLLIFDVTEPQTPKLINQFNPGGFAEDVFLQDNKAYIAFFDLGLVILDISDPLNLNLLAQLQTPGNARGIDIKNNTLYLASWEAGVVIIDISNNSQPQIIGQYDTKGATWGLSVDKQLLYAMDWWGGIKVLRVNEASRPTLLAQYQTAGKINDLLYNNKFIYTAHGSRGLQIYDASNSLNPVWSAGVDFDGEARAVFIQDGSALIAAGDGGLVIIDISNPFQPKWLSQLTLPSSADMISATHQTAFIATQQGDLYSINISDVKRPHIINRYSSKSQSIQAVDGSMYQLNDHQFLLQYVTNKLTSAFDVNYFHLNFNADLMTINHQHIYLASFNGDIRRCNINLKTCQSSAKIKLPERLISLQVHQEKLYATTESNKLYVINIDGATMQLQSIYPSTHKIEQISVSNEGLFFSGESIIASAKRLPEILIERNNNIYTVKIPKNMPLGAYDLNISVPKGQLKHYSNAFEVSFPKLKSKFSMEDFKRKMKQKNLPGKSHSSL